MAQSCWEWIWGDPWKADDEDPTHLDPDDLDTQSTPRERWSHKRRLLRHYLRRLRRRVFNIEPAPSLASTTPLGIRGSSSHLAKAIDRASKVFRTLQQLDRDVLNLDSELATVMSKATGLLAQDEEQLVEVTRRRNGVQQKLKDQWQRLHREHEMVQRSFGHFKRALRRQKIHPFNMHSLRTLFETATVLRSEHGALNKLLDRISATKDRRSVAIGWKRRTLAKMSTDMHRMASRIASNHAFRLERLEDFYSPLQLARCIESIKVLSNPAGPRSLALYEVPERAEARLADSKVQRDYDIMQKDLRTAYDQVRGPKADPDPALVAEWRKVQQDLLVDRDVYHLCRGDDDWYATELKRRIDAGEVADEAEFNKLLHEQEWPETLESLLGVEDHFREVQNNAMRSGLEPAVPPLWQAENRPYQDDPELVIFPHHEDDGDTGSETAELKGQRHRTLGLFRWIGLWRDRVPFGSPRAGFLGAFDELEAPTFEPWEEEWHEDAKSVESSRSYGWYNRQHPSPERRNRLELYIRRQEVQRKEAQKHCETITRLVRG